MIEWSEEQDYLECWAIAGRPSHSKHSREFCFREAGVARFNDVVDDEYGQLEDDA